MRVLVIGSGGREHALCWKLAASPRVEKIYCVPGNPGISNYAECAAVDINSNDAVYQFALDKKVGFAVIGPEMPLVNGLSDYLTQRGIKVFGPSQGAAQIEGSKRFAKDLMRKYNIPTAAYGTFTDMAAAKEYIRKQGAPIVVKADGLAAGKGVVVAMTEDEAMAAIDMIMQAQAFGSAGDQVVVEEFMQGEEASLLAFTDGYTIVPMAAAQDHKRVFDNDQGPNTGGMGAYAPAPVVTAPIREQVVREILQPTIDAMRQDGYLYCGCLYAGLMITADGPKVVEFNARFGDPETQVVLPLLDSDLLTVMEACVDGNLADIEIKWKNQAAVCVVAAAGGYPGEYRKGDSITGTENAEKMGALVFHAGTSLSGGQVVTNGGRVLAVTAIAADVGAAVHKVYNALPEIQFEGMQYRKDIAFRAIARKS